MKFRKKPVVIDAVRWTGGNLQELREFIGNALSVRADGVLVILTLEGDMRVNNDDWIIKGVKGEFYPCKPDIFAETYESVKDYMMGEASNRKTLAQLARMNIEEIYDCMGDMESLSMEEIKKWWNMKFQLRKNELLTRLGSRIDNYPKCKSVFMEGNLERF